MDSGFNKATTKDFFGEIKQDQNGGIKPGHKKQF